MFLSFVTEDFNVKENVLTHLVSNHPNYLHIADYRSCLSNRIIEYKLNFIKRKSKKNLKPPELCQ